VGTFISLVGYYGFTLAEIEFDILFSHFFRVLQAI